MAISRKHLEQKVADAYQIVGALASYAGLFDAPETVKVLDYLSRDEITESPLPYQPEQIAAQRPVDDWLSEAAFRLYSPQLNLETYLARVRACADRAAMEMWVLQHKS